MELLRVETSNVGGLADTKISFPDASVIAFAGSNGSGKSKLLSCLAAPWTQQLPEPGDSSAEEYVEVSIRFDKSEMLAQQEYGRQTYGDSGVQPIDEISIRVSKATLTGISISTIPESHRWVADMLTNEQVQRLYPSLDFIYIPAERRLVSYQGSSFTLMSIDPAENLRMVASRGPGGAAAGYNDVLDDHEFENYARTLCIAAYLPDSAGNRDETAVSAWQRFTAAVDSVLEPKRLLPLTQEDPSNLRIQTEAGINHSINGLSSGERQALIIISRVFRAGEGHSQIAIDEPDAYLHPSLCAKLLYALQLGVQDGGKLLLATHSPAILDSVDPKAIYRLGHGHPPTPVVSQEHLLDLYRSAGFRVSAVTQADILIMTEGDFDAQVLQDLIPELKYASVRSSGGRDLVLRNLAALQAIGLPIVGAVDADIMAPAPAPEIALNCHVWSAADIEGVLLSDFHFLEAALEARLFKSDITSVEEVVVRFDECMEGLRQQTINEIAIRTVRNSMSQSWPSPKDAEVRVKLTEILAPSSKPSQEILDDAYSSAELMWDSCKANKWSLIRGKYVLNRVLRSISPVRANEDFIRMVLVRKPVIDEIENFRRLVVSRMHGPN